MRTSIILFVSMLFGCGTENSPSHTATRASTVHQNQTAAKNSRSEAVGFNLTNSCTRGNCPAPESNSPVIFNRAFGEGHPTIYRNRPVWFLSNEFGVDGLGQSIDGGYCVVKSSNAIFESRSFGYQINARFSPAFGWSFSFANTGAIENLLGCARDASGVAFNEYGAIPIATGIFSVGFAERDTISGQKVHTTKEFIVADRLTAPVSGFVATALQHRSVEGMQRFRLNWQKPVLPSPHGRLIGYYVLVDGAPLRPTWRLVDSTNKLRTQFNRPLGETTTSAGFQFFREAGSTEATSVELEVSPGFHRITLAYQWEAPTSAVSKHDIQAFIYTNSTSICGLLSPPECFGDLRPAAIMTSPGVTTAIEIEDDVSFDRDFYGQQLWWLSKEQLYRHYLEHGIREGRVPSPLLQPHLMPERLRLLPITDALRQRYVDFMLLQPANLLTRDVTIIKPLNALTAEDLVVLDPTMFGYGSNKAGAIACKNSVSYSRCLVREYLNYAGDESGVGSSVFNVEVYLRKNPDVAAAANQSASRRKFAIYHFINHGMKEQRVASATYNERGYLAANPDVATAVRQGAFGGYAGRHYLQYGKREARNNGYQMTGTVVKTLDANGNGNFWIWNQPNRFCHVSTFDTVVGTRIGDDAIRINLLDYYLSTEIPVANAQTPMSVFTGRCN
jgi:hypothetical protein